MAVSWVPLPDPVTTTAWKAVQTRLRRDLRDVCGEAGVRYRFDGERVLIGADDVGPLVYALPLQDDEGRLRADAVARLRRDTFEGHSLGDVAQAALSQPGFHTTDLDRWTGLRIAIMQDADPLNAVRDLAEAQPECRLYRLGATNAWMMRQFIGRIVEHLLDGIDAADMPLGSARRDNALLTGLTEAVPGSMMCSPLTARYQPLAALFITSIGSEIAMLAHGSGFLRGLRMDPWPVGVGGPTLGGLGGGVYKTGVSELPEGHAQALLESCVEGTNRLLYRVTDPAHFVDADGYLDRDEQMIAWANVRFGFDAINSAAALWIGNDAIWAAFRALGTLQGLWEGHRQGAVPLRLLLEPAKLRDHALPAVPEGVERTWMAGLIDNYENVLVSGFPDTSLADAARHMEELRHLVHGVGGQGRRPRAARLKTLRYLSHHSPNVQMVVDMASLWWAALLYRPDLLCTPGHAPWET